MRARSSISAHNFLTRLLLSRFSDRPDPLAFFREPLDLVELGRNSPCWLCREEWVLLGTTLFFDERIGNLVTLQHWSIPLSSPFHATAECRISSPSLRNHVHCTETQQLAKKQILVRAVHLFVCLFLSFFRPALSQLFQHDAEHQNVSFCRALTWTWSQNTTEAFAERTERFETVSVTDQVVAAA